MGEWASQELYPVEMTADEMMGLTGFRILCTIDC
jgi:hypothetical protein